MGEVSERFPERASGVVILAIANLVLGGACLYVLMICGLTVDFWEAVLLGLGMMLVGATTSGVLTHFNRRLRWLWILSFSILPFVYVVPSYIRYLELGDELPITYWTTFSLGVVCACYMGSVLGEGYEMWNRFRRPTRGRFIRMLERWLS